MWIAVTALGLVSVLSLLVAASAHRAVLQPSEVRELVSEIEDVLEKLKARQSRESMRRLRETRQHLEADGPGEGEGQPPLQPSQPGDVKSQLWALANQSGMLRRQ